MRAHLVERGDAIWRAREEETISRMIRRQCSGVLEVRHLTQVALLAELPGGPAWLCEAHIDIEQLRGQRSGDRHQTQTPYLTSPQWGGARVQRVILAHGGRFLDARS